MSKQRILLVDDDPELSVAIGVRLEDNAYDVIFAESGAGSILAARLHMPDVILLDLGLPSGDGFTVLEKLRASDDLCLIPVIVVSGRSRFSNRERALKCGAKAFLQKPVDNALMLSVILQVLEQKEQTAKLVYNLGRSVM
jgi:two-component system, OmpR family, KDP operon response regulator KdpE